MNSSDSSPTSAICQAQANKFLRQQKERKEKQKFFPTNENNAVHGFTLSQNRKQDLPNKKENRKEDVRIAFHYAIQVQKIQSRADSDRSFRASRLNQYKHIGQQRSASTRLSDGDAGNERRQRADLLSPHHVASNSRTRHMKAASAAGSGIRPRAVRKLVICPVSSPTTQHLDCIIFSGAAR